MRQPTHPQLLPMTTIPSLQFLLWLGRRLPPLALGSPRVPLLPHISAQRPLRRGSTECLDNKVEVSRVVVECTGPQRAVARIRVRLSKNDRAAPAAEEGAGLLACRQWLRSGLIACAGDASLRQLL